MPEQAPSVAAASRVHLTRLMKIWRSGGWPCRDGVEIDLLAAGWLAPQMDGGRETLRLTDAGIALLAASRQRNARALSAHDRLAERLARQLLEQGRVVWRELSLRAQVASEAVDVLVPAPLWEAQEPEPAAVQLKAAWRIARPDIFSVRNTTVEAYLQPVVHEVKVSRADLLSDLRHAAKRESYQWLCSECYYVFPERVADPREIPLDFGVILLHGSVEDGRLELTRAARHTACKLPFAVWLALAKARPMQLDDDAPQVHLGEPGGVGGTDGTGGTPGTPGTGGTP